MRRHFFVALLTCLLLLGIVVPQAVGAASWSPGPPQGQGKAQPAQAEPAVVEAEPAQAPVEAAAVEAEPAQAASQAEPAQALPVEAAAVEAEPAQEATPRPTRRPTREPEPTATPQPTQTRVPDPPKPQCQGLAPEPVNAYVSERCLTNDNRYRAIFSLSGYNAEEDLGIWLVDTADDIVITDPIDRERRSRCLIAGTTVTLNTISRCRAMVVNQHGNASGILFDASDLYPGLWSLVFQSTEDGDLRSVLYFEVLPRPLTNDDPCLSVPTAPDVTVVGNCQPAGNIFKMTSSGFESEQPMGYYITGPDRIVEPLLAYYMPKRADESGTAVVVAQIPDTALRGDYYVTAVGGKRELVGTIRAR